MSEKEKLLGEFDAALASTRECALELLRAGLAEQITVTVQVAREGSKTSVLLTSTDLNAEEG